MSATRLLVVADPKMLPTLANGLRTGGRFEIATAPFAAAGTLAPLIAVADLVALFYGSREFPLHISLRDLAPAVRERGARLVAVLQKDQLAVRDQCFHSGASDLLFMPMPKDQFVVRLHETASLSFASEKGLTADLSIATPTQTLRVAAATIAFGGASADREAGSSAPALPLKIGETVRVSWEVGPGGFARWGLVAKCDGAGVRVRFAGSTTEEDAQLRSWLQGGPGPTARPVTSPGIPPTIAELSPAGANPAPTAVDMKTVPEIPGVPATLVDVQSLGAMQGTPDVPLQAAHGTVQSAAPSTGPSAGLRSSSPGGGAAAGPPPGFAARPPIRPQTPRPTTGPGMTPARGTALKPTSVDVPPARSTSEALTPVSPLQNPPAQAAGPIPTPVPAAALVPPPPAPTSTGEPAKTSAPGSASLSDAVAAKSMGEAGGSTISSLAGSPIAPSTSTASGPSISSENASAAKPAADAVAASATAAAAPSAPAIAPALVPPAPGAAAASTSGAIALASGASSTAPDATSAAAITIATATAPEATAATANAAAPAAAPAAASSPATSPTPASGVSSLASLFDDESAGAGTAAVEAPQLDLPDWPKPLDAAVSRSLTERMLREKALPDEAPADPAAAVKKVFGGMPSAEREALEKVGVDSHLHDALVARVVLTGANLEGAKLVATGAGALVHDDAVAALTLLADGAGKRLQAEADRAITKGEVETLQQVTTASAALSRELLAFKETADRLRGLAAAPRLGAGALDPNVVAPAGGKPISVRRDKTDARAEQRKLALSDFTGLTDTPKAKQQKRSLVIGIIILAIALANAIWFANPGVKIAPPTLIEEAGTGVLQISISPPTAIVSVAKTWLTAQDRKARLHSICAALAPRGVKRAAIFLDGSRGMIGQLDVVNCEGIGLAMPKPPPPEQGGPAGPH